MLFKVTCNICFEPSNKSRCVCFQPGLDRLAWTMLVNTSDTHDVNAPITLYCRFKPGQGTASYYPRGDVIVLYMPINAVF